MSVKCKNIMEFIEDMAPVELAEDWDNVGLMLGSKEKDIKRILVCLDVTKQVAEEAVSKKVDLIISHHPLIFKGLKNITMEDEKGSIIHKLIKNDISVYSAHTNLDVSDGGINEQLAGLIGLKDIKNLNSYKTEKLYKIAVYVPLSHIEDVRTAMCEAGAGCIGNYSDCTYMTGGIGTFKPLDRANPYIGEKGKLEKVEENKLETVVPEKHIKKVISAMIKKHPYEEAAYDIYQLELKGKQYGLGKVGSLKEPMKLDEFIEHVKKALKVDKIKLIGNVSNDIKKAAVFCGSFDEDYSGMIKSGADILLTGDIKYHTAVEMIERGLCVIDAGHFNTERIIVPALVGLLKDNFHNIEAVASEVEEDPIKIS